MQNPPFFSIVIPTYNRPERLAKCLESLTRLDYPRDRFEVVVVDDGSKMLLEPQIEPLRDRLDITLIKQYNSGPATARNTGARYTKGQYIAFTDDDCMPAPNWLKNFASRFETAPNSLMGGRTINALPDNLYSTASQELIDYLYQYYNTRSQKSSFFASNNIAVSKEIFRTIGGFDTTFPLAAAEDRELCDRWLQQGYPMIYAPEVQVYHAHHLSLQSFWRQHFYYGRGAFHFHQVRAKRVDQSIKVEPFSFYFNLLTYPLSCTIPQPKLLISALFLVSQIATVTGFFWERFSRKSMKLVENQS